MSKIIEISSDLLDTDAQYFAPQCNCVTPHGKVLSAALFRCFPWADVYTGRREPSQLATIAVAGNGADERFVINMFAQYNPGKSRGPRDTAQLRQQWFKSCLDQIGAIPDLHEVAFPYLIGCGLAGGDWEIYSQMLEDWADAGNYERILLVRKD